MGFTSNESLERLRFRSLLALRTLFMKAMASDTARTVKKVMTTTTLTSITVSRFVPHVLPRYPSAHAQLNPLAEGLHIPPFSQGLEAQPLISASRNTHTHL